MRTGVGPVGKPRRLERSFERRLKRRLQRKFACRLERRLECGLKRSFERGFERRLACRLERGLSYGARSGGENAIGAKGTDGCDLVHNLLGAVRQQQHLPQGVDIATGWARRCVNGEATTPETLGRRYRRNRRRRDERNRACVWAVALASTPCTSS